MHHMMGRKQGQRGSVESCTVNHVFGLKRCDSVRNVRNQIDSQSNHPNRHVATWLFLWLDWLSKWFLTFLTDSDNFNTRLNPLHWRFCRCLCVDCEMLCFSEEEMIFLLWNHKITWIGEYSTVVISPFLRFSFASLCNALYRCCTCCHMVLETSISIMLLLM
jgi:hypothetical protein